MKQSQVYLAVMFFFSISRLFAQVPQGFVEEVLISGLRSPTSIDFANDGRIFISEKDGNVMLYKDGSLLADPFLSVEVDEQRERGLQCVRLDPEFDQNNYVYIYYSVKNEDHNRLSRFTANGDGVIEGSEFVLIDFPELASVTHNGGTIRFENDSILLVTLGEGDVPSNSQSDFTLLGKMVRLHKNGSIPTDNPYYDQFNDEMRAMYAKGFRNPFTFDINKSTGDVFVNDVGNTSFEEINKIQGGKNYGWPLVEGFSNGENEPDNYQDPFYSYAHDVGCAIVGGAFYEPSTKVFPPEYHGAYFFGDYCAGWIKVLNSETGDLIETFTTFQDKNITNLEVGDDGALYVIVFSSGEIIKITYTGSGEPYVVEPLGDQIIATGETISLSVRALGNPTLQYEWYFNNTLLPNENAATLEINNATVSDAGEYYCRISNAEGSVNSTIAEVSVINGKRPEVTIVSPSIGSTYEGADVIEFEGLAIDEEDGALSAENLTWIVRFHHDDHTHPTIPPTSGISAGSFEVPQVGEPSTNVWFRITLIAEDSDGLTSSTTVDVDPEIVSLQIQTEPQGFPIRINGQQIESNSIDFVKNTLHELVAPKYVERNDSLFEFTEWESGETENQKFLALNETNNNQLARYNYNSSYTIGKGNGLNAEYFGQEFQEGDVLDEEIVPFIDFKWEWGTPSENVPNNEFWSATFYGYILPPVTDNYSFKCVYNDGVRLIIDGDTLVDELRMPTTDEIEVQKDLEGGSLVPIKIEFNETLYRARLSFLWDFSYLDKYETVPQRNLYTSDVLNLPLDGEPVVLFPNFISSDLKAITLVFEEPTDQIIINSIDDSGQKTPLGTYDASSRAIALPTSKLPKGLSILEFIYPDDSYRVRRKIMRY